ncbi:hypothetical protein GWK47_032689 [Chionoecetes opilio]|uniref:Uncharacterized protein n=1 Tax=Chionoecetes opilio TaxID=41210 RepID=A0A8J4YJM0_CHIOP|nr:hypothetical protein GWK47_032689 [Chionoecetes opilio]
MGRLCIEAEAGTADIGERASMPRRRSLRATRLYKGGEGLRSVGLSGPAALSAGQTIYGRGILEKSPTSSFPENRLPSRGEVLQVFLFYHKIQKEVLFAAAASTAEKVLEVWRRANIPTSDVSWVKKKILKLYEEYGTLAKSKSRKTETEEMKRCIFRDSLEDMFDIAHSKAMEAKIPEEDKAFLEAQREDWQSCSMAGVDEKLKRATEEKRRKRQRMEEMKKVLE